MNILQVTHKKCQLDHHVFSFHTVGKIDRSCPTQTKVETKVSILFVVYLILLLLLIILIFLHPLEICCARS